jgi:hypothetical protein
MSKKVLTSEQIEEYKREREETLQNYRECTFQMIIEIGSERGRALREVVVCGLFLSNLSIARSIQHRGLFETALGRHFCYPKRCPMFQSWKLLKERGESLKML